MLFLVARASVGWLVGLLVVVVVVVVLALHACVLAFVCLIMWAKHGQ